MRGMVKAGGAHANYQAVREYQTARAHNSGVLTTDLSVGRNFNSRQPKSSLCMDNTGCLITESQNDLITNFLAQYPKGKVQQEMVDSGKRNDLSVNRT